MPPTILSSIIPSHWVIHSSKKYGFLDIVSIEIAWSSWQLQHGPPITWLNSKRCCPSIFEGISSQRLHPITLAIFVSTVTKLFELPFPTNQCGCRVGNHLWGRWCCLDYDNDIVPVDQFSELVVVQSPRQGCPVTQIQAMRPHHKCKLRCGPL